MRWTAELRDHVLYSLLDDSVGSGASAAHTLQYVRAVTEWPIDTDVPGCDTDTDVAMRVSTDPWMGQASPNDAPARDEHDALRIWVLIEYFGLEAFALSRQAEVS